MTARARPEAFAARTCCLGRLRQFGVTLLTPTFDASSATGLNQVAAAGITAIDRQPLVFGSTKICFANGAFHCELVWTVRGGVRILQSLIAFSTEPGLEPWTLAKIRRDSDIAKCSDARIAVHQCSVGMQMEWGTSPLFGIVIEYWEGDTGCDF